MDVSVIIVNYNTCELTLQAIASVYEHTQGVDFEIILVDNFSKDATVSEVRNKYPLVKIIENLTNEGFGRANNAGAAIAIGEYIFLLNSDAYITSNALQLFYEYMKANKQVGVVGGELSTGRDFDTVSYGNLPSLLEYFSYLGFKKMYKNYFETKLASGIVNKSSEIKKVGYVNGADMFIRKSVFDAAGGFDKDFFLYFEETELSYRIQQQGFDSMILPSVKIVHLVSFYRDSFATFNYNKHRIYSKSRFMYFQKCNGLLVAYLTNVITALLFVLQGVLGKDKDNYMKKALICLTSHS
ncbi:glycosyltransferase family 2 protein [Flavobacterium sp.]|uniref:glycosyltransferase family 2 protein n=1 Tax=Flavobacterium sp. TaxID=239 RepID=UPI003D6A94BA